jgi:hypothetical protein
VWGSSTQKQGNQAQLGRPGETEADQQQQRPDHHGQVAEGPGRGVLGVQPGDDDGTDPEHGQAGRGNPGAPVGDAGVADGQQTGPRAEKDGHAGAAAADDELPALGEGPEDGRQRPWGSGVLGLVQKGGEPGQIEQRGDSEGDDTVADQLAALRTRGHAQTDQEADEGHHGQEQGPVVRVEGPYQ